MAPKLDIHLDQFDAVYFLGIGGIGMSALARYFLQINFKVAGYDKTPSTITQDLEALGAEICFEDSLTTLPAYCAESSKTLVIRTPAVPAEHSIWQHFIESGFTIVKRAEVLGLLTRKYPGLAVAGTHGKTTTSTLLTHLLHHSDIPCNAFLGGISSNYQTNFLSEDGAKFTVVEADEFDRSFHQLSPFCSIITAMDSDHLDIYHSEEGFREAFEYYANLIDPKGVLIHHLNVELSSQCPQISYHYSNQKADYYLSAVKYNAGQFLFDVHGPDLHWKQVSFGLPGTHNAENALACIIQGSFIGLTEAQIRAALMTFRGVKRRFEYHIKTDQLVYIDDYAHHPTEIKALLNSVELMYPNHNIVGIFQPHLFSRTQDFFEGFAQELSRLDQCLLMPIYPAREKPIPGITSEALLNAMTLDNKQVVPAAEILSKLQFSEPTVLLSIGAGDIDRLVEPIKLLLNK